MSAPARDEQWWDDYYACRDEGWSEVAAVQYANDILDERLAEQLTVVHGDPLRRTA